jgi:hypothetical protein
MTRLAGLIVTCGLVLIGVRQLAAATYYVDFNTGKDTDDGSAVENAWKHAPGDPAATDVAGQAKLAPGDVVRFKGGVSYKGNLICKWSGEKGKPIVYDGNIDGKWGTGKAILDGSEKLTGWKKCASAEECGGNANWNKIWWTTAPPGVSAVSANLTENEKLLWLSEEPKQPDPFFMERVENFYKIPNKDMTKTSIVDPVHLNQKDEHYWDGASVVVWTTPNVAIVRKIKTFVPAENKITFDDIGGEPYRDREERYCIYNSIHLISTPGEYFFDDRAQADGRHKVFLWPRTEGDLNQQEVTVSIRNNGFDLVEDVDFLTIEGFRIELFSGLERNNGIGVRVVNGNKGQSEGLVVRNNLIRHIGHPMRGYGGIFINSGKDCVVEGNQVVDNPGGMGILIGGGQNMLVKNNLVKNPGSQGIWFMGCKDSQIIGNTVEGAKGTHANGISVYLKCTNIEVIGNRVVDSNIPFTMEDSKGLTIACNIMDGGGTNSVCVSWGGVENVKVFNNLFIRAGANVGLQFVPEGKHADKNIVVKNNIIGGFGSIKEWDVSHNLYLAKTWSQTELRQGELLEEDLSKVFVAPEKSDYHLKTGSPAIGAGIDVGLKTDMDGKPWPARKAPDVGPYIFSPK